jgi:RNA-binding protein
MPAIILTIAERKAHRAEAHHLNPLVLIGANGLTASVQKEVDAALIAHGLIKVRVSGDDRAAREAMLAQLCDALNAAPIQHIGKLLVLWRPMPEKAPTESELAKRGKGPKEVKLVVNSSRGGQRPEIKRVRVLGNQRMTEGGMIKRAKPRTTSAKKRAG